MTIIPFAAYEPDKSIFDTSVTDTIKNVVPTANGYGPFRDFSPLSSALAAAR